MGQAKILAVDDEENFRFLLSHTLQKEGYQVVTAGSGREAIACMDRERFDLVLVDLRMDPPDGLAVLDYIKSRFSATKVIIITCHPMEESARLAAQRGADYFLIKPVEIQELKSAVRTALGPA